MTWPFQSLCRIRSQRPTEQHFRRKRMMMSNSYSQTPMDAAEEQNIVDLEPGSEWRFELEADENVAVRVSAQRRAIACASSTCCRELGGRLGSSAVCRTLSIAHFASKTFLHPFASGCSRGMYSARLPLAGCARRLALALSLQLTTDGRSTPPIRCTSTARSCHRQHGTRCTGTRRARFILRPRLESRVSRRQHREEQEI